MTTVKPSGFAERLHSAFAARCGRPFVWGENDCTLFACDLVEAATGVDYAAVLRGRYRTAAGAARALRRFAGGGLEAAAEKIAQDNGLEEVPPLMAQRGDFVLLDAAAGPALGVCLGATFIAAGPAGAVSLPLKRARRAWRV